MAPFTGKTLDQYKSDYDAAQREYNSMLQGSGGGLSSVSSLEHAKKKLDLAADDYGQAQRTQSTSTTHSGTIGTIDTPVLNEFLASHKTANPVSNSGYTSQRLENGMAFNSPTPLITNNMKNYLGSQNTSDTNSHSSTQLFNELNNVKPFALNAGSSPPHIINTSTPIFNPELNSASKVGTPVLNVNGVINSSLGSYTGSTIDNMANLGVSSQNSFRGGYGSIVNTDTYRTTIDPSIIDADTADLKSLKSAMTAAYSHYDTLRAGQSFSGTYGIRLAGQEAQTNDDITGAYQAYLTAEKAYNNAVKIHNYAQIAKTVNADVNTINNLESVKSNADFAQKSVQGKLENTKLFDNYAPSTGTLKRGQAVGAGTYSNIDYMTPDEQSVYAYLLSTDKTKAKQYKDALTRSLNYRSMSDYQAMVKDQSEENSLQGVLYNALGNAEKPFGFIGTAAQAISSLISGNSEPLDRNSGYFIGSQTAETSENALVDKANTPFTKWLTQQGLGAMNAVPTIVASVFSPEVGAAIMASESAGGAAYSVAERGGTAAQAAVSGLITGTVQYAVGKIPLGKFNEIANATKAASVRSILND